MNFRDRLFRLATAVVCALLCSLLAIAPAVADDAEDEDAQEAEEAEQQQGERPDPPLRRNVYDAGSWSVGIDGLFSRTSTRVEFLDDQGQATDTTRFLRIDPWATVGIFDRFHVGAIVGFVSRRVAQDDATPSGENAMAVQPMAQYYLRVTSRLSVYGQLAPGMYFGRSERTIPSEDDEDESLDEEQTSTLGFVISTGLGINYRLSEGLQLRFGLTFNGLWGRESVDSLNQTLSSSTTNMGTNAGLRYTF